MPPCERTVEELREWLKQQAILADKSSHEWQSGGKVNEQSAYRSGEWFAYRNVLNFLTGSNFVGLLLIAILSGCTTPHNDHYEANVDLPPDWMLSRVIQHP